MIFLLKATGSPFYLCEIHGAVFITWVHESEREEALAFLNEAKAQEWAESIGKRLGSGVEVVKVEP